MPLSRTRPKGPVRLGRGGQLGREALPPPSCLVTHGPESLAWKENMALWAEADSPVTEGSCKEGPATCLCLCSQAEEGGRGALGGASHPLLIPAAAEEKIGSGRR